MLHRKVIVKGTCHIFLLSVNQEHNGSNRLRDTMYTNGKSELGLASRQRTPTMIIKIRIIFQYDY